MQRERGGSGVSGSSGGGGLGPQLVGEKISVNKRPLSILKQLGEGGFSYVYLVKDESEKRERSNSPPADQLQCMVLKITSIHSREQRQIAEKEAHLLRRLNHPSIVHMYDCCYRDTNQNSGRLGIGGGSSEKHRSRPQHLILMEYCPDGHALDIMTRMEANGSQRYTRSSLIIAFGQICNAVSYLHAQKPPIVHRDLKPNNFLVSNGTSYKLCDFGSSICGDVELNTQKDRRAAEEVIQKTTTQMFRAPEMVDLYMTDKLTEVTDVWALGCCLFSMAFFQNCFEEGSNLAILSTNYKIPDDNSYGDDLVDLIDRMLTVCDKDRADMTEVIMCLSAMYADKKMPSRRRGKKQKDKPKQDQPGKYRTDAQGIHDNLLSPKKKPAEAKKLNPNSAAARRKAYRNSDQQNPSSPSVLPKFAVDDTINTNTLEISRSSSSITRGSGLKNDSGFDESFDAFPTDFGFGSQRQQLGKSSSSSFHSTDKLFSNTNNPFAASMEKSDINGKDNNSKVANSFDFGNFESCLPSTSTNVCIPHSNSNGNSNTLFDDVDSLSFSAFKEEPLSSSTGWSSLDRTKSNTPEPDSCKKFNDGFPNNFDFPCEGEYRNVNVNSNNDGFPSSAPNFPADEISATLIGSTHDISENEGNRRRTLKPKGTASESIHVTGGHGEKNSFPTGKFFKQYSLQSLSKSTSFER